mgnify:CR=1 FL=1
MINNKILLHADDFGRSAEISKNILKCLEHGCLNSVSVMVNHDQDSLYKLKKIEKINIRLHLNLTEIPSINVENNEFLSDLNFFKLLLPSKSERKIIIKEINNQINKFMEIFEPKNLKIDGHEHVHLIPWIHNYLANNYKIFNISEMRNSYEELMLPRLSDLFNARYLRNFTACILIKFFRLFNKEFEVLSPKFSGLIYSGMQDEKTLVKTLNFFKKKKINDFEILIHPGFTTYEEKKFFKKEYFDFYISPKRKIEYDLCFSKKIKEKLLNNC